MIQVEVATVKNLAAVLAGVAVTLENVVPRELHILAREAIKEQEQDHPGNADPQGNSADDVLGSVVGGAVGEVPPLLEVVRLEISGVVVGDDLGVPFEKKGEGAADRAKIHRLPKAIEHQNLLAKGYAHMGSSIVRWNYWSAPPLSIGACE